MKKKAAKPKKGSSIPLLVCNAEVVVNLGFQDWWSFTSAGPYVTRSYALNNAYDPVYTVGGGSCTGYSQWMALYQYARVESVEVMISAQNESTSVGKGITVFAVPFPSTQTPSVVPTLDLIMESAYGRSVDLFVGNSVLNPGQLAGEWSLKGIEGNSLVPRLSYSSTSSGGPDKIITCLCGIIASDGISIALTGSFKVRIVYRVLFWQRRVFGT